MVPLSSLTPHPRNYRNHPDNQIEHLMHSIREFGFYRNIVIAEDGTILAGHGISEAARRLDLETVPVVRLGIGPEHPLALKLLAADNYLPYFAEDDDRLLTEMLKELAVSDYGLLGTGFDENQLALLTMVTRPASEIADFDAAAEWVGMPEYEPGAEFSRLIISFESDEVRDQFVAEYGIQIMKREQNAWSTRWPFEGYEDLQSLRFVG